MIEERETHLIQNRCIVKMLSNVQMFIPIGCFTQSANCQALFKDLNDRYGMGMEKRFFGEIVTYLTFTVPGN
jgi:hypothetical protein